MNVFDTNLVLKMKYNICIFTYVVMKYCADVQTVEFRWILATHTVYGNIFLH